MFLPRTLCALALTSAVFLALACSSDTTESNPGDDDDSTSSSSSSSSGAQTSSSSGAPVSAFACSALAYCSYQSIKEFYDVDAETPAGGTPSDGTYRLAYETYSLGGNTGYGGTSPKVFTIEDGSFVWAGAIDGSVGTVSVSGTTITFEESKTCALGDDAEGNPGTRTYEFSATADRIVFIGPYSDSSEGDGIAQEVYLRIDGDLCAEAATTPTTPGADTVRCDVSNCGCLSKKNGTLEASSCDF